VGSAAASNVRRATLIASACLGLLVLAPGAQADHWQSGQCGVPAEAPLSVEYAQGAVSAQIRNEIFGPARPPLVLATSGAALPARLRALGAHTVHWHMKLRALVGLPATPADPAAVAPAAERLAAAAASSSACPTPLIALNELNGAGMPLSPQNEQYRANVLTLVQQLHALGARPFLLVPRAPFTATEADRAWWLAVASSSNIVRELYFHGPYIYGLGPVLANRARRQAMRRGIASFTSIGIPPGRLGIMHGFQSGIGAGGREGLQLGYWLQVVKWDSLAARQIATEFAGAGTPLGSLWSWGWGNFAVADGDKHFVACVYLWARNPALCDGPGRAQAGGVAFNPDLAEGQDLAPTILTTALAPATLNQPYFQLLTASVELPPATWSIVAGVLPPGVRMDVTTGFIAGVPTTPGAYAFTVQVADAAGRSAALPVSITVVDPAAPPAPAPPEAAEVPAAARHNGMRTVSSYRLAG
jgi:hypothetical protein